MTRRIRPSWIRQIPRLAFCAGGVVPFLLDDAPVLARAAGVVLVVGGALFLLLVATTWFEFDDHVVRVAVLNSARAFASDSTTLRTHPVAIGFFAETTAVELVSQDYRRTVSLATFKPGDRELIRQELRERFGTSAASS